MASVIRNGVVDAPLWLDDELILLSHNLALENWSRHDESLLLTPIGMLDLDGCRPFGDIEDFNKRG